MSGSEFFKAVESTVQRVLYNEVSTFFPARVTGAKPSLDDPTGRMVVVDLVSAFAKIDDSTPALIPLPINLIEVPLWIPNRTENFVQRPPLDPASLIGTYVGCWVSNNYLQAWRKAGNPKFLPSVPKENRKFHIADAVAMLGMYPDFASDSDQSFPPPQLPNTAEMLVKAGTFLKIGTPTIDILKLLRDLVDVITANGAIIDGAAGADPNPVTTFTSTAGTSGETLATILTKLNTVINPTA
jgi:hypothetical protein